MPGALPYMGLFKDELSTLLDLAQACLGLTLLFPCPWAMGNPNGSFHACESDFILNQVWIGHKFENCRKKSDSKEKTTKKKMEWRPKNETANILNEKQEPEVGHDPPPYPIPLDKGEPEAVTITEDEDEGYTENKRKELWKNLSNHKVPSPWCVLGDFNTILHLDEKIGGTQVSREDLQDFQDCLNECGLEDLPYEGPKFTWTNNQETGRRIYSKLDRVLGNVSWVLSFNLKVYFKEEGISDHSPMILKSLVQDRKHASFKFCDMWTLDPHFPNIVAEIWDKDHQGYLMHQVVQKLKQLKEPLKSLNRNKFKSLDDQIEETRSRLNAAQGVLRKGGSNPTDLKAEKELRKELQMKMKARFLMWTHQSKVDWISMGDQNSKLFYAWLKKKKYQNHITTITDSTGEVKEGKEEVAKVLVDYYQNQLGKMEMTEDISKDIVDMGECLSIEQQMKLISPISPEEVKKAVFDGYSSGFFKNQWHKVGPLITNAVQEFF
ncbi:unnamed protein product [Cuscuta campestris]|uniref:Endonuclease/exonuclease/phosphatase domain-containing protein n=1 Tax=Cuscuta campestris TaxID=132261 RepID=A0A484MPK3_9ASTE|nr:unnamed protein product [Cuscuta campestris]